MAPTHLISLDFLSFASATMASIAFVAPTGVTLSASPALTVTSGQSVQFAQRPAGTMTSMAAVVGGVTRLYQGMVPSWCSTWEVDRCAGSKYNTRRTRKQKYHWRITIEMTRRNMVCTCIIVWYATYIGLSIGWRFMFVWFASLFAHWSINCSRHRYKLKFWHICFITSLADSEVWPVSSKNLHRWYPPMAPLELLFPPSEVQAALLCRSVGKRRVKQGKVAKVLRNASKLDQLKQVTGKDSTIPLEKYRTGVGDRAVSQSSCIWLAGFGWWAMSCSLEKFGTPEDVFKSWFLNKSVVFFFLDQQD